MAATQDQRRPRQLVYIIGAMLLLAYLGAVGYEWYNEGFLPIGPQR